MVDQSYYQYIKCQSGSYWLLTQLGARILFSLCIIIMFDTHFLFQKHSLEADKIDATQPVFNTLRSVDQQYAERNIVDISIEQEYQVKKNV